MTTNTISDRKLLIAAELLLHYTHKYTLYYIYVMRCVERCRFHQ